MEQITEYLPTALAVLGGVVAALAALAPVTPTHWDDKVLAVLQRILAAVKVVGPKGPAKP